MAIVGRNKVLITGTIAGGESWSVGLNYAGTTVPNMLTGQDELNDWADSIAALIISGSLTITRNALSTAGSFGAVTTQYYDSTNTLTAQSVPSPVSQTGLGTPSKPAQTAIVVSLQTGRPGASYRGRIYVPAMGGGMNSDLQVATPTAPQDLADQWATFIGDCAIEAGGLGATVQPVIYSPTKDVVTVVTGVRVGNRYDTQRRRRNEQVEFYAQADV